MHDPRPHPPRACPNSRYDEDIESLAAFLQRRRRLLVLTGAGCSTASGIPDYRDKNGCWKHRQPMSLREFTQCPHARQRYWAGSLAGWQRVSAAHPNRAHRALAAFESKDYVHSLITQNVDGLHQQAGSSRVIDLHGRLDSVECLDCRLRLDRGHFQRRLERANREWLSAPAWMAPDGDTLHQQDVTADFQVPACPDCAGILKPAIVFFGETIPRARLHRALQWLDEADGLLVVGSSLMVYSGYRFLRRASQRGLATAAVNLGTMRAGHDIDLRFDRACEELLSGVRQYLSNG